MSYNFSDFETIQLADFTGGLNITDPPNSLPANQFSVLQDMILSRQGVLGARAPFRPEYMNSAAQKVNITDGSTSPDEVLDVHVIRNESSQTGASNYRYSSKTWVVVARFSTAVKVLVFRVADDSWRVIKSFTGNPQEVSVVPYRVNNALDILMFPDNATPWRWAVGTEIDSDPPNEDWAPVPEAMGLTKPVVGSGDDFEVDFPNDAGGDGTLPTDGNLTLVEGQKFYYKFSYYYDNDNDSTILGESDLSEDYAEFLSPGEEPATKINIDFDSVNFDSQVPGSVKPLSIKYVHIYRSLLPEGPYKYIDRCLVTHGTDAIVSYEDETPVDFEGTEHTTSLSDPTATSLYLKHVVAIGSQLWGFDATLGHKLHRSTPGFPDVWQPLDHDYLDGDGRGIVDFNRKLFVFSEYSVFEKSTPGADAVKISKVGCISGRTIQNVGRGICWADYDSVYFADFVTLYGSKGDFPKDVGHPISDSVHASDPDRPMDSFFANQRYHVSFYEGTDDKPRHYIYDVDFSSWQSFSMGHPQWARLDFDYWSVGQSTLTDEWYIYKHDYNEAISEEGVTYVGRDFHDYYAMTAGDVLTEQHDIPCRIGRSKVRLGLNTQKAILLSAYLEINGLGAEPVLTLTGGETEFVKEVAFTEIGTVDEISTEYPARYEQAVYAAGSGPGSATADYHGYVGVDSVDIEQLKKIIQPMKSSDFEFLLTFGAARDLDMITLNINFRLQPKPV